MAASAPLNPAMGFTKVLRLAPPAHQSTPSSSKHHWRSVLSSSGWRRDEKEVLDGGQTKSNVTTKNMITISYCQQERCRCHQEHNPIVIYRHGCELVKQPIHYHSTFCFCMSGGWPPTQTTFHLLHLLFVITTTRHDQTQVHSVTTLPTELRTPAITRTVIR